MKSATQTGMYVRPMRVFVGHKTKIEQGFRGWVSMPKPAGISPGVPPTPEHNLTFNSEKTIADLVFTNFYVGGPTAWHGDMDSIDRALAAAMSDRNLNNVMVQYYPSGATENQH